MYQKKNSGRYTFFQYSVNVKSFLGVGREIPLLDWLIKCRRYSIFINPIFIYVYILKEEYI